MPARSYTPEQELLIVEAYKRLKNAVHVGAEVGFPPWTVLSILKRHDVTIEHRRNVTEEERAEMVRLYTKEAKSTWDIAKQMGYLNVCVMKNLKRAGVVMRNRSMAAKIYTVNQDYFREIDTPVKAYILGLIWSDGNMSKDSFTLCLQERDKSVLDHIRNEIEMTGPLNFRKRQAGPRHKQNMWALRVHDKAFCAHLKALGIVERKTSKLCFPTFLSKPLRRPFLLGLFDGDGSISIAQDTGKSKRHTTISLAGSECMMRETKAIIKEETGANMCFQTKKGSRGCTLSSGATQGLKIMNWLYAERLPFQIERKLRKYEAIAKHFNTYRDRRAIHTLTEIDTALTVLSQYAA